MTRVWSREAQEALIKVYKKHPCLYQVSSPYYYNREYNRDAVEEMVEAVSQFYPDITSKECKKKYLILRNQFSVQHRKLKKSCLESDGVCTPKLWCYNQLLFLTDHIKSRPGDFMNGESSKREEEPKNNYNCDDDDDDDNEKYWPIETVDVDASTCSYEIYEGKRKWEDKEESPILNNLEELRKLREAKLESNSQKVPSSPKNSQFCEFLSGRMDQLDPDLSLLLQHSIMKKMMEYELIMENRNKNK